MPENRDVRVCEAANTPVECSSEKTVLRQQDGEASPRQVLLEVKDLEVTYGSGRKAFKAVNRANFEIYKGETFGLVGESGSGKTTIGRAIMRILPTSGGEILYKGQKINGKISRQLDQQVIKEIQMIFQDPMTSLNPIRTIGSQITEVIEKHQGISRGDAKKQAIELMERVGIQNAADRFDEYPFQYSGGMRQRIVIAIALSCHPKILICDEPTTALDVTIQAQIIALIRDLQKELKFTTIYITHDLGVVANVADRVGVMYGGQIIEYGNVEEVFFDPRHPYTWALMNSVPRLDLDNKEQLVTIEGTIPDMIHPPKGCAFCSRCPYAMNICAEYSPETIELKGGHQVACWLTDPRADVSGVPFHTGGEQDEQ